MSSTRGAIAIKEATAQLSAAHDLPIESVDATSEASARQLLASGQVAEAMNAFTTLLAQNWGSASLFGAAAEAAHRADHVAQAIIWIAQAERLEPKSATYPMRLAQYCQRAGDLKTALRAVDRAILLAPKSPAILFLRSRILHGLGLLNDAADIAQKALAMRPDNDVNRLYTASLLYEQGRFSECKDIDLASSAHRPNDAGFSFNHRAALWRVSSAAGRKKKKVLLLGNCNVETLVKCFEILLPHAMTRHIRLSRSFLSKPDNIASIIESIRQSDIICYQPYDGRPPFHAELVKKKAVSFPPLIFDAFHPDQQFLRAGRDLLQGPLASHHSHIIASTFLSGGDPDNAIANFSKETFRRLKYFDRWRTSSKLLEALSNETDVPISQFLTSWMNRGCFMFDIHHPKLFALKDIARALILKMGETPENVDCEDYMADPLGEFEVLPVYPEIAEQFGFQGSYLFKGPASRDIAKRLYDLPEFAELSFRTYDAYGRESISLSGGDMMSFVRR